MTAVEWLEKQLDIDLVDNGWYFEKAKEMEQQQIMDAWNDGFNKVAKLIKDATQRNLNL